MSKFYGTGDNQIPSVGDLGDLAFQNTENVRVDKLRANELSEGVLPIGKPSVSFNFTNSGVVDPRIRCQRAGYATYRDRFGTIRYAPNFTPRIDYDPETGECLGLAVEESRTNYHTYPFPVDGAYSWAVTSLTADLRTEETKAPDGTYTATAFTPTTTNGNHLIRQNFSTMETYKYYTVSTFVKQRRFHEIGGATAFTPAKWIAVRLDNNTGWARFNIEDGTVALDLPESANDGLTTTYAHVEKYPNGWYRLSATFKNALSGDNPEWYIEDPTSGVYTGAGSVAWAGDGTNYGAYFWGFQCERAQGFETYGVDPDTNQGMRPYPTSYIPHLYSQKFGSTITKDADFHHLYWKDILNWTENDKEVTVFISMTQSDRSSVSIYSRPIQDFNAAIQFMLKGSLNSDIRHRSVNSDGSTNNDYEWQNARDFLNVRDKINIVLSVKSGATMAAVNGKIISRNFNTWENIFTLSPGIVIGNQSGGARPLSGHIREMHFWNTALSEDEIKGLSGV